MRLVQKDDINQVTLIDREAFSTLWPPVNYRHEIQNPLAHYIVACDEEKIIEEPKEKSATQKGIFGLASKVRQLLNYDHSLGNETAFSGRQYIFGFAVFSENQSHIKLTELPQWCLVTDSVNASSIFLIECLHVERQKYVCRINDPC